MPAELDFRLPEASYTAYTWVLFDEHTPVAAPPLNANFFFSGAANDDDTVPRSILVNGYRYQRRGAGPGGPPWRDGPLPGSVEEMRRWRVEWQPQVDGVVEGLMRFDASQVKPGTWQRTLEAQAAEYWRVFGPVHRFAVMPAQRIARHFEEAYVARFGKERLQDARALLQGFPNASRERAELLWQLSRSLRAEPEIGSALDRGEALPESAAGREFGRLLAELLERFGSTSEGFVEDQPTWAEDPSIPLAAVRAYAGQTEGNGPLDSAVRQRQRREELEAELRAAAADDAEAAELLRLLPIAQELMPNMEDHNYYTDQRLNAASRQRWLAVGRQLQGRGLVDGADDVFYFYRDELVQALEGQATPDKALLAERRADLKLWRSVPPPPVLGKPVEDLAAGEAELPVARASEVRIVRGVGASPGSFRGRARVIDSIAEAATLQPGDVLVTRVTTPAWTPFFGVVSALVINVGGALSHAAVVAREFGLPAVVGTVDGSVRIRDGETVTVDGTHGLVLIEDEGTLPG